MKMPMMKHAVLAGLMFLPGSAFALTPRDVDAQPIKIVIEETRTRGILRLRGEVRMSWEDERSLHEAVLRSEDGRIYRLFLLLEGVSVVSVDLVADNPKDFYSWDRARDGEMALDQLFGQGEKIPELMWGGSGGERIEASFHLGKDAEN